MFWLYVFDFMKNAADAFNIYKLVFTDMDMAKIHL